LDDIVIATTIEKQDDEIVLWCQKEEVACYRGSQNDVLQRYLEAARIHHADVVVRVTGDCPIIDPEILDKTVNFFLQNQQKYDYVSNTILGSYPRGLDVEVFSMNALEKEAVAANREEHREHVTLYFYEHPEEFRVGRPKMGEESSDRWTVDTEEDLTLVTKIIEELYSAKPNFSMQDVLDLLDRQPWLRKINSHISQKPVR
jgi:spore coat polysaccharide biosynthesis protein SpsF